jgi:TonB family protein
MYTRAPKLPPYTAGRPNRTRLVLKCLLAFLALACGFGPSIRSQEARVRVALIGIGGVVTGQSPATAVQPESALRSALASDSRVSIVDQSIVRSAVKGVGYDGSINMSRDEARSLGSAIGCDFFITGKLEAFTRSERTSEEHEEAIAGVMVVDGRTGALAVFDFVDEKAQTREAALEALAKTLTSRAASYADRMSRFQLSRSQPLNPGAAPLERIEDIPEQGSTLAEGFTPPDFLNRVKPEYTEAAERADITATVEASAVFRGNGEIGEIRIVRWAGFGLDESAERAIRQLKFKAAARDGRPVSVRAIIRYNFRRLNEPAPQTPKPEEKAAPDLRRIFKTRPPVS